MHSSLCPRVFAIAAIIFSAMAAAQPPLPNDAAPAHAGAPVVQRWSGHIEIRGTRLPFGVALTPATVDHGANGTIDIPVQGLKAVPLSEVVITTGELRFTFAVPGTPPERAAVFVLALAPGGASAAGEMRQSGMTATVSLARVPAGQEPTYGPARPQEPRQPFPYAAREVTYTNPADGTTLAGTLTIPAGPGPHPAVVMITGSGAQDRDETLAGHKPFLVIADHLSRRGIAVLRSDDRGVGGSGGNVSDATTEVFAADVLAAIAMLKELPEIDRERIGVVGHSEGGIVGPMAAAKSRDVAFVVMLAGTGLKGRSIIALQSEAPMRAAGLDDDTVLAIMNRHGAMMDLIERGAPRPELEATVRDLIKAQTRANIAVAGPSANLTDAQIDEAVALQVGAMDTVWFRAFVAHDPRETFRFVKVPVLALNGGLDVQVPARANLPEIEKALRAAGNPDVTVQELPGLNHMLQTARTGRPDEYAQIEETISPGVLEMITAWITARTAAAK